MKRSAAPVARPRTLEEHAPKKVAHSSVIASEACSVSSWENVRSSKSQPLACRTAWILSKEISGCTELCAAGFRSVRGRMFRLPSEVSLPRVQSLPNLRPGRLAVHSTYGHSPAALPPLSRRESEADNTTSIPSLGRLTRSPSKEGLASSSADFAAARQFHTEAKPPCLRLHLESEGAESAGLTLTSAGEIFLVRKCEQGRKQQQIVSHGSVTLPAGAGAETFTVVKQIFDGQRCAEAHVTWGPAAAPVARMSIYSSQIASKRYEWCKVRILWRQVNAILHAVLILLCA